MAGSADIRGLWFDLQQRALSYASSACLLYSAPFADLARDLVKRFVHLPAPSTEEELALRSRQQDAISQTINSIGQADSSAKVAKRLASAFYDLARSYAVHPIPETDNEFEEHSKDSLEFTMRIQQIGR